MLFTNYMMALALKYPNKQIDIVLEENFVSKKSDRRWNSNAVQDVYDLSTVLKEWSPCLEVDKTQCTGPPNVRFTYVDFRGFPVFIPIRDSPIDTKLQPPEPFNYYGLLLFLRLQMENWKMQDLAERYKIDSTEEFYDTLQRGVTAFFLSLDQVWTEAQKIYGNELTAKNISTLPRLVWFVLKMDKQLSAVRSTRAQHMLEDYYKENIADPLHKIGEYQHRNENENILGTKEEFVTMLRNQDSLVNQQKIQQIRGLLETIITIDTVAGTAFMDLYTLARMLRCFQEASGSRFVEPSYIFFYGGDAHSRNYRKFLTQLSQEAGDPPPVVAPDSKEPEQMKCLSVENISWDNFFLPFAPVPGLRPCPL